MELYHRPDNALFVPETAGTPHAARFLFAALGLQPIGYSPFGLYFTRTNHPERMVPNEPNASLDPTAQNYKLLGPIMREVARLNFEGKMQAVADVEGQPEQTLHFRIWDAVVSYGVGRGGPAKGNTEPIGRALVAQLSDNQFLEVRMQCCRPLAASGADCPLFFGSPMVLVQAPRFAWCAAAVLVTGLNSGIADLDCANQSPIAICCRTLLVSGAFRCCCELAKVQAKYRS